MKANRGHQGISSVALLQQSFTPAVTQLLNYGDAQAGDFPPTFS